MNVTKLCGPTHSRCGYCRGERAFVLNSQSVGHKDISSSGINGKEEETATIQDSSKSYGLLFESLTSETYQTLVDKGWRRSGSHLYKPHNWESCCPAIAIRLDQSKFKMSKSQRKVWKAMEQALAGRTKSKENDTQNIEEEARPSARRKKQRRNGAGKNSESHTITNHNFTTTPLPVSHEHPYEEATGIAEKSQVLVSLRDWTVEAVLLFLRKRSQERKNDSNTFPMLNLAETRKLCSFKPNKSLPRRYRQRNSNAFIASTTVAAALSGRSRGKFNKSDIASDVSAYLCRRCKLGAENGPMTDSAFAYWDAEGRSVGVQSVEIQEKSCHINVTLVILPDSSLKNTDTEMSQDRMEVKNNKSEVGNFSPSPFLKSKVPVKNGEKLGTDLAPSADSEVSLGLRTPSFETENSFCGESCGSPNHSVMFQEGNSSSSVSHSAYFRKNTEQNQKKQNCKPRSNILDDFIMNQTPLSLDDNGEKISTIGGAHTLNVRSVPAHISAGQPEVHRLFALYQTVIHGDPDPFTPKVSGSLSEKRKASDEINKIEDVEPMKEDDRTYGSSQQDSEDDDDSDITSIPGSYDVDAVYGRDFDEEGLVRIKKAYTSFHRFLCETPLPVAERSISSNFLYSETDPFRLDADGYDIHVPYGTYHQQYRIDGKHLIAVGVVDILPHCLSSVYAFYDPELSRRLNLGKYTALREIEWVRRASIARPALKFYYLGFYIHSCQKMRYKADYRPSELLCPTHFRWVPCDIGQRLLDLHSPVRNCCTLYRPKPGEEEDNEKEDAMSRLKVNGGYSSRSARENEQTLLHHAVEQTRLDLSSRGEIVTVSRLNSHGRKIVDPLVKEFIQEVGIDVSRSCVIKI